MNSQVPPERERDLRRNSSSPDSRPRNFLPRCLELMRPNGSFYPLEAGDTPIKTPNGYIVGMREHNGVLRPLFCQRIIVKVRRVGIGHYDIVPLTLEEYRHFNFNNDITTNTDRFMRYIGVIRERANN